MREILFRGKCKKSGRWFEGFPFQTNYDGFKAWCISTEPLCANEYSEILGDWAEVIPETIGQYIGLTDENGKKIFEGDVVREYGGAYAQGFYEIDGNLIVEIPNTLANFILGSDCGCKYKIIGNIHDNPELLEGGECND